MDLRKNRIFARGRWIFVGALALACSACASEEVATSPGGMMPPEMAGVKAPDRTVAAQAGSPWAGAPIGMPANPSDPATLTR